MQAVILAGGRGTRLRPLTNTVPKPLIPIGEKYFLYYLLKLLSRNGISKILLCLAYLSEKIIEKIGTGSNFGCEIDYSIEKTPLGTAGAIKNADHKLEDEFMTINGDTFLPIDYTKLINFWNEKKSDAEGLIVLYDNREKIVPNNIKTDDTGKVTTYSKNSVEGKGFVDSGVQIFKKSILSLIQPDAVVSLEEEIFPKIIDKNKMISYITSTRYYDIGTPERFKLFEKFIEQNPGMID